MPDLTNIPTGWLLASDGKSISREFVFRNFIKAVEAINIIKDVAEAQNHHPDLHLTQYKKLKIVLSTHDAGGITNNDLNLAGLINAMDLEKKNV
jgi:4a-hydroxytetrahydrobiopterin dehydratase